MTKTKPSRAPFVPDGLIHLYWGWRQQNAKRRLEVTRLCYADCGVGNLPPEAVTLDRKLVTCPECQAAKAERREPEQPKVTTPPDATKKLPRGNWPWAAGAKIKLLTPANPQSAGSSKHKRWSVLWQHSGKTWEQYRDAGGNPETLRNAVKQKYVEVQS